MSKIVYSDLKKMTHPYSTPTQTFTLQLIYSNKSTEQKSKHTYNKPRLTYSHKKLI